VIIFISFDTVIEIHDQLIEEYGGRKGILNEGLLKSSLEMPKACFNGKDLYRTVFDKTAAYLFYLIKNHPFVDGNKRTASMVAMIFFASNYEHSFLIDEQDYQDLILRIAKDGVDKKEIAKFFRQSVVKHK
jgi:death-on-curing protein